MALPLLYHTASPPSQYATTAFVITEPRPANPFKPARCEAPALSHVPPSRAFAAYGPNADRATKIAIFRVAEKGSEPELLDRWIVEEGDVRRDPVSEEKVLTLLRDHQILSIAMVDRIIGCPHEEGIDYPDGQSCPQCPFWAAGTVLPMSVSTSCVRQG